MTLKDVIVVKSDGFDLPEKHRLKEGVKTRLHIRTPWMSKVERLSSDGRVSVQCWIRDPKENKPFVPRGTIEIDGEPYTVRQEFETR